MAPGPCLRACDAALLIEQPDCLLSCIAIGRGDAPPLLASTIPQLVEPPCLSLLAWCLQEEGYTCHPQLLQAPCQLPAASSWLPAPGHLLSGLEGFCKSLADGRATLDHPAIPWVSAIWPPADNAKSQPTSSQRPHAASLIWPGAVAQMRGLQLQPATVGAVRLPGAHAGRAAMVAAKQLTADEVVYHTEYRASAPVSIISGDSFKLTADGCNPPLGMRLCA